MAESKGSDGSEEQEAMLERLLTRLALTDDSKLESVLAKLLPYAISCLGNPRQSTKQKVMEILSHINKRVKDQLSIKLPLPDLLNLYKKEEVAPMVKSFSLVYMEMAFNRHSQGGADLAPLLLDNISKAPIQHQDMLLRMAIKELEKYASERMDGSGVAKYTLVNNMADRDIFLDFCLQTMIYQAQSSLPDGSVSAPAGLSKLQMSRVLGKPAPKGDFLLKRKLGIMNVVTEMNMPPEAFYPLLIVASADNNDHVTKRAEELIKKKAAGVNLEDPILLKKLFSIFQGTLGNNVAVDARVSPGSPLLKAKLMNVFTRSITAANSFPATLHCIFDCIYGNESFPRLKHSGMEFTVWTFKHASDEQIKPMAPIVLSNLVKILDNPPPVEADAFSKQLRMFAYQVIGQLGHRAQYLFRDSIEIVARLFKAFKTEPPSLRFTVQEAITSLASAYKDCSEVVAKQVDSLLLSNVYALEGEARFCSVWWAKNICDFKHCASRFICMVGTSDERLDVRDMALEGLQPLKQEKDSCFPPVSQMLDFICEQQPMLLIPAKIGEQELLFQSKMYISMIDFLLKCHEGTDSSVFEERLALLLEHAMASNGSAELHAKGSSGLLVLAVHSSKRFVEIYCKRVEWLRQFLGHVDMTTREFVARILGIVTSGLTIQTTVNLLEKLSSTFRAGQKGRFEDMHGAVCACGFILAQCMVGVPAIPSETFQLVLLALLTLGKSGNLGLSGAVVEAIGFVGLRGILPVSHEAAGIGDIGDAAAVEVVSFENVLKLFDDTISSKDAKAVQKAVIAYGHLCYGDPRKGLLEKALGALLGLSRSKVEEVLFAVGEALCFIWGGLIITADEILKSNYVSLSSTTNFLSEYVTKPDSAMETQADPNEERASARETIVRKLFDELLFSARKEERCAGAVWLVSIITYCGRHHHVQRMLPEIQEALSHLLGDQNELTQEMASRGMSILYEVGDIASREELVKALVNTLSGTAKRKRAIKLTEDSEIFEEGVLGEKPGGGNITTYKELCSLANEMGQPDLIYKFMDLANHQAAMNSKRGAAFGFAKIARQAREALSPYLPSLVPKLIRYQYDPNKQVQDAMGHIWRAIVAEPKKTIDELFDPIMEDLLSQAGSRLWRSRESSCLALADLIQGRRFHEVQTYLEPLWVVTFRTMDDVKETTRTAGESLGRSVGSLSLRLGDTTLTSETDAKATVSIILPVLLSKGIMNNMVEVQRLAINTVMKLAKTAGSSIRPQLPDLVICMLESLSSLEDQRLNYAELHAERAGLSTDKLESLRFSVARDSPMWETLDFCLHQVDEQTLGILIPRLMQLVRSGVGLNTRVGVAKFISSLTQQVGSDLKQHAGILLKALKSAVLEEKSSSARRAFASACAAVARYAAPTQIKSLFEDTIALYRTGTDSARTSSGLLLKELSNQASDIFVGYHSMVLPIAFLGRFEDDKNVSSIFDDLWEENTSGQGVSLQLYASDIIPLVLEGLSSTSWKQKQKSAKAISKLAEGGGDSISSFVQPLLKALLEELPSRLWEGKEVVLDAISAICKNCTSAIPSAPSPLISRHTVVSAVCMACNKKKASFRNAAFSCLEQILGQFKDPELFPEVFPFLLQCCTNTTPPSKGKEIADEDEADKSFTGSIEKALTCLCSSIATATFSLVSLECDVIVACLVEKLEGGYTWQVKMAALTSGKAIFGQLRSEQCRENVEETHKTFKSLETLFATILECASSIKVGQMRMASLECLMAALEIDAFNSHLALGIRGETLSKQVLQMLELEKIPAAKALLQSILKKLQINAGAAKS